MNLTLLGSSSFPLDDVAKVLKPEGVKPDIWNLGNSIKPQIQPTTRETAVLVVREPGVAWIGEHVHTAKASLGMKSELTVCSSPLSSEDRRVLAELGATGFMTPRSWSVGDVAERILAECIVSGRIQPDVFGLLRGATQRMRKLYDEIRVVAPLDDTILILGETGTGKELIAQEIHKRSGRAGELLAINCAELRPELLGSELFGHVAGAFTDARQDRKGLFAEAGEGTVFLDEIGELDRTAQAQLLRLLENRTFRPVGSNRFIPFKGRVVLATHQDLEQACLDRRFRYDLFQRIQGFTLSPPPLRERRADIPLLARHFVEECRAGKGYRADLTLAHGAIDALFGYDWPGNVRELRFVIRRSAAFHDGAGRINGALFLEQLRSKTTRPKEYSVPFDPKSDTWQDFLVRAQVEYGRAVLSQTGGNRTAAAKLAGFSRSQFYEKFEKPEKE